MSVNDLVGKTIKSIEVDGFGVCIHTTDGIVLDYSASDGGYSSWDITKEGKDG